MKNKDANKKEDNKSPCEKCMEGNSYKPCANCLWNGIRYENK